MRSFVFALATLVPGLAFAAGKPLAADQHSPALTTDFGGVWINVVGNDESYVVKSTFSIIGATSKNDRMRMDWKSGGKLLGSAKCTSQFNEKSNYLSGNCDLDDRNTVIGPIDADLVYIDDQTDKEYLVTTYHVTVKKWKGPGKSWNWGITPDDLLAVGFVRHWHGDPFFHVPLIEFWSTSYNLIGEATFRCTVDGKKLPDLDGHVDTSQVNGQSEIQVDVTTDKDRWSYLYRHYAFDPGLHFGSKADHGIYDPEKMHWVIDNPGKWECTLRKDGHQIRQFMFTVNDKGMVEESQMQKGSHRHVTASNVVLIDMKIPADNGVEKRIRPDAMKKSIGFGVAWPDGPTVKDVQAAFPPASGTHD